MATITTGVWKGSNVHVAASSDSCTCSTPRQAATQAAKRLHHPVLPRVLVSTQAIDHQHTDQHTPPLLPPF
jgi:hypothetical protein